MTRKENRAGGEGFPMPGRIQKTDLKGQVEEALMGLIRRMDLSVSAKLPREEELARMLGVSRITLRSVLDELAAAGVIFRRHGKGTFVNQRFMEMKVSLNPVLHFSDMIANSGYRPGVEILDCREERAGREAAKSLGISEGAPLAACEKIFYADGQICAVTRDLIPLGYLGGADLQGMRKEADSVFYFIYKATGKKLAWDEVELNAVYSSQVELLDQVMKKAGLGPRPFLLLKGINYDQQDAPAVLSLEYIDTTVLKFSQIRRRVLRYERAGEAEERGE